MPITLNVIQKENVRNLLNDYVREVHESPFDICEIYPSLQEFFEYVGYITEEDLNAYEQIQKAKGYLNAKFGEGEW